MAVVATVEVATVEIATNGDKKKIVGFCLDCYCPLMKMKKPFL